MNIAVTGASGMIGRRVCEVLAARPVRRDHLEQDLAGADAVVHLAGEPIAQRWTSAARHRILESRDAGTLRLVRAMEAMPRPPAVLVSASAVGYYGSRGDEVLTEDSSPGTGFLPEVCLAWERGAAAFHGRVVRLRIGVVLSRRGGALPRMLTPFRLGVGGRVGSGRQWMSWIHIDDLVGIIRFALEHPVEGVWNATSPNPVTNADFTRAVAEALHRPAIFPVPAAALRLLFGEMSEVLLGSQRVQPQAAVNAGFTFAHPEVEEALALECR